MFVKHDVPCRVIQEHKAVNVAVIWKGLTLVIFASNNEHCKMYRSKVVCTAKVYWQMYRQTDIRTWSKMPLIILFRGIKIQLDFSTCMPLLATIFNQYQIINYLLNYYKLKLFVANTSNDFCNINLILQNLEMFVSDYWHWEGTGFEHLYSIKI